MRFAYIDSNGNEVPIPSVDALALRIELGAINGETELYDAQADQWGPAHTHEIFHTLSRAAGGGEQDFVAPPPPMPRPAVEEPEPEPEAAPVAEVPAPAPPEAPEPVQAADLGLTLADESTDPGPADAGVEGLGLALSAADTPPDVGSLSLSDSLGEDDDDGADFDFGDLGGGLEMEPLADTAADEPAMDFSFAPDTDAGAAFGGLEQEMEFSTEGLGGLDVDSGGLDLEQPMSEFSPEAPPVWMEPEAPGDTGEDVMDFSSVSSEVAGAEEAPSDVQRRAQRQPKTKPSAPKHRRQRSLVGPIVGVVLILGVGMGSYVAWPIISTMFAERGDPVEPSVVMPDLPAELLPQMRELAGAAFASTFADARAATGSEIATPSRDWLGGRYLANAGDFQNVEAFWNGVGAVLDNVREIDGVAFHAAFAGGLATAGVAPANAALMAERADSGFVAAAGAREGVYAQVDELLDAALGLHRFLASNEDNIEYTPASAGTSDPILEAKPSSPEIQQAMNDGFDRVNDALGALGYPGLVTADGLWSVVLTRIQEVGIQ